MPCDAERVKNGVLAATPKHCEGLRRIDKEAAREQRDERERSEIGSVCARETERIVRRFAWRGDSDLIRSEGYELASHLRWRYAAREPQVDTRQSTQAAEHPLDCRDVDQSNRPSKRFCRQHARDL